MTDHIPGVDLDRLLAWMDTQGLGTGAFTEATPLTGGSQNILVRIRRDGPAYVLRRGPEHKRANTDETMRREARVLGALAGSGVPHPGLIAACPDESVLGGAFYLMEPIDGFTPANDWPHPPHSDDEAFVHEMGLEMARAIGRLGAIDHVAVGLGDLGKPDGWLERQVPRWLSHLEGYLKVPGYPPDSLPHVPEIAAWLEAHRPAAWTPGLIHGDFHYANVVFDAERPTLAAMVDWELTTIGDPMIDLGHLLATWPPNFSLFDRFRPAGLPSRDAVIEAYESARGRRVEHVDWYEVLASYRLAIIIEGTLVRAIEGKTTEENGQRLHTDAVGLLNRAVTLI